LETILGEKGARVTAIADQQAETRASRLRRAQRLVVVILVFGYAGYYLCRVNLSVATPLLIEAFGAQGMDKARIGAIASVGTLCYAFGKFASGSLSDMLGGRRLFLTGMGGAVLFTLLFGLGGLPLFTLAWAGNRLVQSAGWGGMVQMTSRWFGASQYGAVMGIISLSYLFGDFASRLALGELAERVPDWRWLFVLPAVVLSGLFLLTLTALKASPCHMGLPEPEDAPLLPVSEAEASAPASWLDLLRPLLLNRIFWMVCLLSLGFTLVRETFNTWTPQYLVEMGGMSAGKAGKASSLFPLFGGISVLICGIVSDRLGRRGRAAILCVGLTLSVPALILLASVRFDGSATTPLVLLGTVAFLMIGPYSLLAGAIALDFGGKRRSATACGWIDGVGYLGGVLAGNGIGAIAQNSGWKSAFLTLSGVAAVSWVIAIWFWLTLHERRGGHKA
jgi:MFS transporter, OPA family, glycerol-3-phosphate transporter